MAASAFKRLSWQINESLNISKLNAMTNNDNWLYENTPRLQFWGSVKRTTGLRLLSGTTYLAPNKTNQVRKTISFGSFFSAGVQPIIVTGINAGSGTRTHCTVQGISTTRVDHQGMVITLYASNSASKFTSGVWVHWHATGY